MRIENIKLYNSKKLIASLFDLYELVTFQTHNNNYSMYISKSFKVLYFVNTTKQNHKVLISKETINRNFDKDKAFNDSFMYMSFLVKNFDFEIYSMNFEIFK